MNIIIASTSTVYGGDYLDYLNPQLKDLYKGVDEIVFIPYARPSGMSYDEYTAIARKKFEGMGIKVKGIHEYSHPKEGLKNARGIFTGGGNTFVLVKTLYEKEIMSLLKKKIEEGTPYLGTSAGSNITGQNMKTTNDMPIVEVPTASKIYL